MPDDKKERDTPSSASERRRLPAPDPDLYSPHREGGDVEELKARTARILERDKGERSRET